MQLPSGIFQNRIEGAFLLNLVANQESLPVIRFLYKQELRLAQYVLFFLLYCVVLDHRLV